MMTSTEEHREVVTVSRLKLTPRAHERMEAEARRQKRSLAAQFAYAIEEYARGLEAEEAIDDRR